MMLASQALVPGSTCFSLISGQVSSPCTHTLTAVSEDT